MNKKSLWSLQSLLTKSAIIICLLIPMVVLAQGESSTPLLVQDQGINTATTQQQESRQIAAVRLAHMLPGVPRVDLTVDGRLRLQDVVYGDVSGYMLIPFDRLRLRLMPQVAINNRGEVLSGNQPPELIPITTTLEPDKYYTIVFSYTDSPDMGERVFSTTLLSIFEDSFDIPLPGQARVRFNNSGTAIGLSIQQLQDHQEPVTWETLELPLLSTLALNIPLGSYSFSFAEGETDLQVIVHAGTYYTFYLVRDGENLVINPDVDGVLGTLSPKGSQ